MKRLLPLSYVLFFVLGMTCVFSQSSTQKPINLGGFNDGIRHARSGIDAKYAKYQESQVREIAENILLYQNPDGGWPKNIDLVRILSPAEIQELKTNPRAKINARQ